MQKKILFITTTHIFKNELIGIKNKILTQYKAMLKIGLDVDLITINEPNKIYLNNRLLIKFQNRYLFSSLFFIKLSRSLVNKKYDYIYIRNPFIYDQIGYIFFLKQHKKCLILLELPTYPYKKERTSFYQRIVYLVEYCFRRIYKHYINIVLYSGNKIDSIYGIKAIQIKHGSDFEYSIISKPNKNYNPLNLVAVASFAKWHGFERILEGIKNYKTSIKSKIQVHLFLIGHNEPLSKVFIEYINKNDLKKIITMTGSLQGSKLEEIYQKSHIGIGSLGLHRIGLNEGSPLKSAEYAVRGIPFVVGYKDSTYFKKSYCLQIPGDESPVNIDQLINWFKDLHLDKSKLRKFTIKTFSWDRQLTEILKLK